MPGLTAFTRIWFFKVECPSGQTIARRFGAPHAGGWDARDNLVEAFRRCALWHLNEPRQNRQFIGDSSHEVVQTA